MCFIYSFITDYFFIYFKIKEHLKPKGWFKQTKIFIILKNKDKSIVCTSLRTKDPGIEM
jgi:hypothetical protein